MVTMNNLAILQSTFSTEIYDSLLKFFSKKNKNLKMLEISNLIEPIMILIIEKAMKQAEVANRKKLTVHDLVNSINENHIVPFIAGGTENFKVFKKKKNFIVNGLFQPIRSSEIFKEINKKFFPPSVFEDWYILSPKNFQKKKKYNFGDYFFNLLIRTSISDIIFLCYSLRVISNKKVFEENLTLKIISDNYKSMSISQYFFFWASQQILKSLKKAKIFMGLRIMQAITFDNVSSSIFYIYKKIISILTNLIFFKIPNEFQKNSKIINYSFGIIKNLYKKLLIKSDLFFFQVKYLSLRQLFTFKPNRYPTSEWILILFKINHFTNELFLIPLLKKRNNRVKIYPNLQKD